jgi:hypothetical protein
MNKKIDITSPSERANNTAIGKSIIRKGKSAIKKDMASKMKEKAPTRRLDYLRKELDKERISYGELAELSSYKKHLYNDPRLAEAAGISEDEYRRHQKKSGNK